MSQMALVRWLALGLGLVAAVAAITFRLADSGSLGASPSVASAVGALHVREHLWSPESGDLEFVPETSAVAGVAGEASGSTATGTVGAAVTDGTSSGSSGGTTSPASAAATGQLRLRVPELGVDAVVSTLGFDGAGGFAVPSTASGVGWYEFSAAPGAAGNAVMGGHLNWAGSRGVFDRLDELAAGDMIYVDTAAGEIAYRVVGSHSVTAETPFVEILGERSGPSTLTLFTCGGTFSRAAGEYNHRLVVNAVRA